MAVAFDESHLGRFRVKRGLGGSGQREVAPGRALRSPPHTRKSVERGAVVRDGGAGAPRAHRPRRPPLPAEVFRSALPAMNALAGPRCSGNSGNFL